MKIRKTNTPAVSAGVHISDYLNTSNKFSACTLAGGSALDIIPYIRLDKSTKGRTIFIMGDERVSGESSVNNYLQLRSRFPEFVHDHLVVDTSGHDNETVENFATRISKQLEKIFQSAEDIGSIAILGMGSDGHTAGIFPMEETQFSNTYKQDVTYVPVINKTLTIDSRASLKPEFFLECENVVAYITGDSKAEKLKELIAEDKFLYEMPAQIIKQHTNSTVYTDINT